MAAVGEGVMLAIAEQLSCPGDAVEGLWLLTTEFAASNSKAKCYEIWMPLRYHASMNRNFAYERRKKILCKEHGWKFLWVHLISQLKLLHRCRFYSCQII
jgi:hypothetical protein